MKNAVCIVYDNVGIYFKIFMCMNLFLMVCMQTTCISGTLRGQKRSPDPMQLELWVVLSSFVGAEN